MSLKRPAATCTVESTVNLCPHLVSKIGQDIGSEGLTEWISIGGTQSSKDHKGCTPFQCYANEIEAPVPAEVNEYQKDACTCQMFGPDLAQISAILDEDKVPIVAISVTTNTVVVLIKAYTPETTFTSVSHASVMLMAAY